MYYMSGAWQYTVKTKVVEPTILSPTAHQRAIGVLAEAKWWALLTFVFTVNNTGIPVCS